MQTTRQYQHQIEDVIPDDEMILETRPFAGCSSSREGYIHPHSGTHEVNFGSPIK
jgi:hypothetical protein